MVRATTKTKKETVKTQKTEETEKSIGLFDVLDMIQTKRTPWDQLDEGYKKAYSQFMINRFISSNEMYLPILAKLTEIKQLTDEQHYMILCNTLSPTKHWFNYKTYKKEKVEKDMELLIFACCKEYEIGKREARMYINNLTETVKEQLCSKWAELYKNSI